MHPYGLQLVLMGLYAFLWVPMDPYGYYKSLCVLTSPYRSLLVLMSPYGSFCVFMNLYVS